MAYDKELKSNEIKIYDKDGNLKRTVPATEIFKPRPEHKHVYRGKARTSR